MVKGSKREKRTTIGIAMAMCGLAVITAGGFFYANRAFAKETLQGITKIVKNAQEKDKDGNYKHPFVILEIIPDYPKRDFTVKDINDKDIEVKDFPIDIGSAGYYIKGEEPSTKNLRNLLTAKTTPQTEGGKSEYYFNDSESRKNIAEIILDSKKETGLQYLSLENNDQAIFYADTPAGYKELRLGEVMSYTHSFYVEEKKGKEKQKQEETLTEATEEVMERLVADKTFIALPRDYQGGTDENGNVVETYIDTAKGIMTKVPTGQGTAGQEMAERGNYTRNYMPLLNGEGRLDEQNDPAYLLVSSGKSEVEGSSFKKIDADEKTGEFDPYFVTPTEQSETTHRAVFGCVGNVMSGYRIVSSKAAEGTVAEGTPLYTYNIAEGVYEFARYAGTATKTFNAGAGEEQPEEPETIERPTEEMEPMGDSGSAFTPKRLNAATEGQPLSGDEKASEESAVTEPESGTENSTTESGTTEGGTTEGGSTEGTTEGGTTEGGSTEGTTEGGTTEGSTEGTTEGSTEGTTEGSTEGTTEGGSTEGTTEGGTTEGGSTEGTTEGGTTEGGSTEGTTEGGTTEGGSTDGTTESGTTEGSTEGTTENPTEGESGESDQAVEPNIFDAEGDYHILHFVYVPENTTEEKLYQVISYDTDASFKEYGVNKDVSLGGAVVPNVNGTGIVALDDISTVFDQLIYDYTPKKGAYNWTGEAWLSDKNTAEKYRIRGAQIYYSTGLINRDFFKQHVFDREESECDDLPIEVWTMPASAVEPVHVGVSNLLILQRGEPYYGCANGLSDYPKYGLGDGKFDISGDVYDTIVDKVDRGYPVVSDYGIYKEDPESDAYIHRLTWRFVLKEWTIAPDENYTDEPGYDHDNKSWNKVNKSVYIPTYGGLNDAFVNSNFSVDLREYPWGAKPIDGFEPVLEDIRNENAFRMASGKKERLKEVVSQATIIRYIIAYSEEQYTKKDTINILEIAPCASYTLYLDKPEAGSDTRTLYVITGTNDDGEITNKEKMIEFKSTKVNLTQMTTSEFIGRVEDINARYDMVYIGSRTTAYKLGNGTVVKMNHAEDGVTTAYNDETMNGLIYANVGDTFTTAGIRRHSPMVSGENGDIEKARFSGNDITEEKDKALQDFIDAGFPVVVADELVDTSTAGTAEEGERVPLTVNTDTVDKASYLYHFLHANRKKENLFSLSEVLEPKARLLNLYLNVGRPILGTLADTITKSAVEVKTEQLNPDSNGNYRAVFEFRLESGGITSDDMTYDLELFIDINADGKFSKTTEEITQFTLEDLVGNTVGTDENGRYMMRAGNNYCATYILSSSQRGVLPWKIRVTQNDDTRLKRADLLGYYEIRDPNDKPEDIRVLQLLNNAWYIFDDGLLPSLDTLDLSKQEDYERVDDVLMNLGGTGFTWNMQKTMDDTNTEFSSLINNKQAVPYNVIIRSIPWDWLNLEPEHVKYQSKKFDEEHFGKDCTLKNLDTDYAHLSAEEYLAFFRNFDMLVIGFADAYNDPPEPMLAGIKLYIEEGRSILFTHDNTSPYTYPKTDAYKYKNDHGYRFNRVLRDTFALNRYRCYYTETDPATGEVTGGDYRSPTDNETFRQEKAYVPKSDRADNNFAAEDQGLTYTTIQLYPRYRFNDESKNTEMSYMDGMRTAQFYYYLPAGRDESVNIQRGYYEYIDKGKATQSPYFYTNAVESVNSGQITCYPYKLDEKFPVAETHGQWWQLDFTRDDDVDGESDLVVWYTLSGSPLYDMSPKDVRNNYYIFNMGSITYSGVGHSDVMNAVKDSSGNGGESINEIKLFINTLIAAYQSGLHDPEIRIIENYNAQSRDIDSFYLSYDEEMKLDAEGNARDGVIDETEDIYFIVNSTSLVRNDTLRTHTITAEFYAEVPEGAEGSKTLGIKGGSYVGKKINIQSLRKQESNGSETVVAPDENGNYLIDSGVVYKATVPLEQLRYYKTDETNAPITIFDDKTAEVVEDNSGSGTGGAAAHTVNARNSRTIMVMATEEITNKNASTSTKASAMDTITAMRLRVFDMD